MCNEVSHDKCEGCRWVQFVDAAEIGENKILIKCQITGKTKELTECIKN